MAIGDVALVAAISNLCYPRFAEPDGHRKRARIDGNVEWDVVLGDVTHTVVYDVVRDGSSDELVRVKGVIDGRP